ncbi:MAG: metallophosphoesterase [Gemmatimonadota bacterium]|jgi:hypothetical protein
MDRPTDDTLPVGVPRRTFLKGIGSFVAAPSLVLRRAAPRAPQLSLLPFLTRPTGRAITISARNGHDPATGTVEIRPAGSDEWMPNGPELVAQPGDFFSWPLDGLEPGSRYDYRIRMASESGDVDIGAVGGFTTQRGGEAAYTAALVTDSHTGSFPLGRPETQVTADVVRNVLRDRPEFVIALGDNVAWATSRNEPQTNALGAERAYGMYRTLTGPLTMSCPHFGLIGNWEGESGKFQEDSLGIVRSVRHRFTPNPTPDTYPWGGGREQDYYAFPWGPALYIVLNVQGYTRPSAAQPSLRDDVTTVDDWTLGPAQMSWFERTLSASDHPFKFVCIHHAVGGDAASERESLYGRGGARAADTGEQIRIHELMREHGVQIFFYGHDHVFVDDVVDDIHYALPGSFGAPWKFGRDITGYGRFWTDSGHARITVEPAEAVVEYLNLAGQVIHLFSVKPG